MISEQAYHVEVEALEPVRVGGAPDPLSGQDNPVAIVGSEATIPGSSLKGALRAEIERFLIDRYYDGPGQRWPDPQRAAQPCLAATRVSLAEEQLLNVQRYRITKPRQGGRSPESMCALPIPQGITGICSACYLLGAQGLVGFVKVPFLWCQVSPDALYSARIDRTSSTVAQGTNREYQLLPRGTRFSGTLYLLEEDTTLGWRLGQQRLLPGDPDRWLTLGWDRDQVISDLLIGRLQAVNYLGGYKSKGMGRVRITVQPA